MKRIIINFIIVVSFLIISIRCNQPNKNNTPDEGFVAYVAEFTQGIIPANAAVNIRLTTDIKSFTNAGAEAPKSIFRFKPDVSGTVYWIDNRSIRFIPDKGWPLDTKIQVSVHLNQLLDLPPAFHQFQFEVQTLPLSFEVYDLSLYVPHSNNHRYYALESKVRSSDVVDADKLAATFTLRDDNQAFKPIIKATDVNNEFVLEYDSIMRRTNKYTLNLKWDGKNIGSFSKGEMTVMVPAIGEFSVQRVEVDRQQQQQLKIWFSDFIDDNQNLQGIIQLNPTADFRISIEKNLLLVHPVDYLSGDYELSIAAGIKNSQGQRLIEDFTYPINFDPVMPEVRFTGNANILAGDGKSIVSFQARGLKAVDVQLIKIFPDNILQFLQWNQLDGNADLKRVGRVVAREQVRLDSPNGGANDWQTYAVDLDRFVQLDKSAVYRLMLTFKRAYSLYACDSMPPFAEEKPGPNADELRLWGDGYYDDPSYYYPQNFRWNFRNDPCNESYYYYERFVSKNILFTNLGLLAKQLDANSKTYRFYVNELSTAKPLSGVAVKVYDYQQQMLQSGVTDQDGSVVLDFNDIAPFIAVAERGKERTFLKLDEGSALPVSRFDVQGAAIDEGMKAFIFTERGVYRPGDTIHAGFILKSTVKALPADYPVQLELYNVRKQLVSKQLFSEMQDGMGIFKIPTNEEDPTGLWEVQLVAGNSRFYKSIRVENIKPNRLKLKFEPKTEYLNKNTLDKAVLIQVNWLHGAIAKNMKLVLEQRLQQLAPVFQNYTKYSFDDISRYEYELESTEKEGVTDSEGNFSFLPALPKYLEVRGKLKVQWIARVMEPGGDISVASHEIDYYPYSHYLGLLTPDPGSQAFLYTDEEQQCEVVRLNQMGVPEGNRELKAQIFRLDWSWWWSGNGGDKASYVSANQTQLIHEQLFTIREGRGSFNWKLQYPAWGNFLVKVSDPKGGHSTSQIVYVDWPESYSRSERKSNGGPSLLSISTDKESYQVGQQAVLSFSSPAEGRALISLENGSRQLRSWWVDTKSPETVVNIPLDESFSPNVYAHVTLLQPFGKLENDMPLRSYGIATLLVDNPKALLKPEVLLPKEAETSKKFDVAVREQSGKPMYYMLAVVDEGLLDLTNFKTPDPYKLFYAREALGIKTWDMYDFVLGAYGGHIEQLFTIGGDEGLPNRNNIKERRFEPVAKVLGPFRLEAGKTAKHTIAIDNYIGSVRAMLVAVSGMAVGSAENTMKISQPLMVLGTLPRQLRPAEEAYIPVTIFSGIQGKHEIALGIQSEGACQVVGSRKQQILLEGPGEAMAYFKIKASDQEGDMKVKLLASSGKHKSQHQVNLFVQNPNQRLFRTEKFILKPGESIAHQAEMFGVEASRTLSLEISTLPSVNLRKRLSYLLQYPYGCTEQISSQGFAQLYLPQIMDLTTEEKNARYQSINEVIRQLSGRLRQSGSITYWPGSDYVHPWTEIYAGHFMILAKKEQFGVSDLFLKQWSKEQKRLAQSWRAVALGNTLQDEITQAYRLYVLALHGDAQLNAMNRLREDPRLSKDASLLLASAYMLAGQTQAAQTIAFGQHVNRADRTSYNGTFGSALRQKAIQLHCMQLLGEESDAFKLASEISSILSGNESLNTQEIGWALFAWQQFSNVYRKDGKASMQIKQSSTAYYTLENKMIEIPLDAAKPSIELVNTGEQIVYVQLIRSAIEKSDALYSFADGLDMKVQFKNKSGDIIDHRSLKQGTPFTMDVDVKNTGMQQVEFLALSQFVASGWEIVNNRIYQYDVSVSGAYSDFKDARVDHFFNLLPGQTKSFSLELIASYQGKFFMPVTRCSAMYDSSVGAAASGGWVEVVKE